MADWLPPGSRRPKPDPAEGIAPNGRPRESVWDYPRPPKLEPVDREVTVELAGERIATSTRALRVCETAGPPVVYLPPADIASGALSAATGTSFCEWKGTASYYDVEAAGAVIERAGWFYPQPNPAFATLRDHVAFYPGKLECYLDGERVLPQPGPFYGGWITAEITGPFKGNPGSEGW